jgi:hypothetical protein
MPVSPSYAASPLLDDSFPLPLDRPFTLKHALEAGVTSKVLRRLHAQGYLRRMLKGVYVAAQATDDLILRAQALALVMPERAVVVDWTAVWLYTGLLPPGEHLAVAPVTFFRHAGHGRLRNDLCQSGERTFLADDIHEVIGLRVTTPLRTTWDIGRFAHPDIAIGAMDALLRTGLVDRDEMLKGVRRFNRQRWVTRLRMLAPLADGAAESPGESLLRLRWLMTPGMPAPVPQVPIYDDDGRVLFRLDLGDPETRYAAEFDGVEHHSRPSDRDHDRERRAWIEERRLWTIDVFRGPDLTTENNPRVELLLQEGVARARRRLGTPIPPPTYGQDAPTRRT